MFSAAAFLYVRFPVGTGRKFSVDSGLLKRSIPAGQQKRLTIIPLDSRILLHPAIDV